MSPELTHQCASLKVETITSSGRLESLAGEWGELWRRSPVATPFQSPHWLLPWWRLFGGAELCVFAACAGGRLCALIPLFRYTAGDTRRLALIGTGITDIQGVLIDPAFETSVSALFGTWLRRQASAWDECDFQQLSECGMRNVECGIMKSGLAPPWRVAIAPQDPCLVLPLPDSSAGLDGVIPGPMLKNVRYCRRRAREAGEVSYERAAPETFDEIFTALLRLHGARWGERGEAGVLADEQVASFHRQASSGMLADGLLRLYALRLRGRIIACHYGFHHGGVAYYYLGGFDPEFSSLSPGTLIVAHAIEEALGEGAREFNFLRGREPYKYRWGARDRPCHRLQIINPPHSPNNNYNNI